MLDFVKSVQDLVNILPFIRKYSGKVMVIKYGGAAMISEDLKRKVLDDVLFLYSIGIKLVLIHGGGPVIDQWLNKCGIKPQFRDGIRVTDAETMEIVEMVLAGKVNKNLVALLNKSHSYSIGLSGKDGNLINASSLSDVENDLVGKVNSVKIDVLNLLLNSSYIPVVASVAADVNGQSYNINADTVAGAIAKSLNAEKLILLTDTPGIMYNVSDKNTLIKSLTIDQANCLIKKRVISGGMIPKVDCCIDALQLGVKSAHIIDGRIEHSLLLEILTLDRIGSMLML
uniref:acetylglutamate kinase n=1 Tax=Catenella fusiformis TaxID=3024791 RepID=UPI0027DA1571|nr:acetylglutamate kinase [Catenella fusiformis]WCH57597.1 acetylglutamate kinase [Catenella fusiformis]